MKNYFLAIAIAMLFVLSISCSKGDGANDGNSITNEDEALLVFAQINSLWNSVLEPQLTTKKQTLSDSVLTDGASGKATVNGSYTITSSSSTNSSLNITTASFYVSFSNYTVDGLTLDGGPLHFYEYHYSRTACSSGSCATSTSTSMSYKSSAGLSSDATPSITLSFTSDAGTKYNDKIIFSAAKQYAHWSGTLINSKNDTIGFIY
ncbi:MAG: hypothetical protein QM610_09820 [Chitinophagaceae bacterium]